MQVNKKVLALAIVGLCVLALIAGTWLAGGFEQARNRLTPMPVIVRCSGAGFTVPPLPSLAGRRGGVTALSLSPRRRCAKRTAAR